MSKEIRNLVIFFIATFIWTWVFYLPIAVSGNSQYEMPWMILLICGGMGPSLVGVAIVLLTYDKEQRRDYWRRCFSLRRIHLLWWVVIFLIFPVIFVVSIAIDMALGGSMPGMEQLKSLIANPTMWPLAAFISFMSGPWSEEFGWRGYALEPITKHFGTIPGSIGLGVIWAVWHLPLYFMSDGWHAEMGFKLAGFWTFIVSNVALSLIMAWVYLNTNRSILSSMMLHFTSNFTAQLIAPSSDRVEVIYTVLMVTIGVIGCTLLNHWTQLPRLYRIKRNDT